MQGPLAEGQTRDLYILGSGESALSLGPSAWNLIARSTSIGIGAWSLHSFVPNFLAIETPRRLGPKGINSGERFSRLEESYNAALHAWAARRDVQESKSKILFFRPNSPIGDWRVSGLPPDLLGRTYLYGRFGAAATNPAEAEVELEHFWNLHRRGHVSISFPYDLGNTVSRLIGLGLMSGFRSITLVGVDLKKSRYFWEAEPLFLHSNGIAEFFTGQPSGIHLTESSQGKMPASKGIEILAKFARSRLRVEILAAHRSSWLSNLLPLNPSTNG